MAGLVDFTNCDTRKKAYSGANGHKISIVYDGELYMLKFPFQAQRNENMSYANSCISEFLGCKIFKSVGIPVQEVLLGTYNTEQGQEKIVVACKDMTVGKGVLQDFASMKNQIIDLVRNGYGTDLSDILDTIDRQQSLNRDELLERFWDMFIVDALIGNWDRHNGNWGFLYDEKTDALELAPVFDCGSSLYPQADEEMIEKILADKGELHTRVYNVPLSAITQNGRKINYYDFISGMQEEGCNRALARIFPRINLEEIGRIVDSTPAITELQKTFYKTVLGERWRLILQDPYLRYKGECREMASFR